MKLSVVIAVALLLLSSERTMAAPIALVDQTNVGGFNNSNGGVLLVAGQSFVPSLAGLDAVELSLGSDGTSIVVDILDGVAGVDGLSGILLASSQPTFVETGQLGPRLYHFDFDSTVSLNPGDTYVARVRNLGATSYGIFGTNNNLYPQGQKLHGDFSPAAFATQDLIFTTGLHAAVPEPSAVSLLAIGLLGVLFARARRSRVQLRL